MGVEQERGDSNFDRNRCQFLREVCVFQATIIVPGAAVGEDFTEQGVARVVPLRMWAL